MVTRIHNARICIKIQVYDVMVEYNNEIFHSILTPPFNQAPFKHFLKTFRVLSVGSRVALCTSCINSINKLRQFSDQDP